MSVSVIATTSQRDMRADLIVIGAGSGGLSVAAGAAMLGLKVVLYEKAEMGGDCLNHGCIPSKALLAAAKSAEAVRTSEKYGIKSGAPTVDWARVKVHVRRAIDTIAPNDSQERFEKLGVRVIREQARFVDPETIVSDTTRATARRIVIASGSTAFIPSIPGLDTVPYLTNETLFDMPSQPAHLLVLGGGPIGMEMAQAFRRLGAMVTVIEMVRPLILADEDHAAIVIRAMRGEGVDICENHRAIKVSGAPGNIIVETQGPHGLARFVGTHLLVAVGRRPVLDGLCLKAGHVAHDERGVQVDAGLRSVSNRRVWALGDVAGRGQFTHLAGWHASLFIRRALFKQAIRADSLPVPTVTFTDPELACIGLTTAAARARHGDQIAVCDFPFGENDRAIAEGKTCGGVRLLVFRGRIMGASVVGEGAGDIIQIIAHAMSNRLGVRSLTNFISPYPTRAEIVKRAASAHFAPTIFGKTARRLVRLLQRIA